MIGYRIRRARRPVCRLLVLATVLSMLFSLSAGASAGGFEMGTSYPGQVVRPGDELDFTLEFYNTLGYGFTAALTASDIPGGWTGRFEGNGSDISSVYVHSGEEASTATFHVEVPDDAAQGTYTINLRAAGQGGSSSLALTLEVNEEASGSSALTTEYAEQQGSAGTAFTFSSTIQNNSADSQTYSFSSNPPAGWMVAIAPSGESTQVSSVTVEAHSTQGLDITVTPPENVEAGTYTIPLSVVSASESLSEELSVEITGSYALQLSTPSGLLSFDANANKQTAVTISVTNTGNVDLQNINLSSSAPDSWTVEFSESSISVLEAGATQELTAYVTPSDEAISGDYVVTMTASSDETSSAAEFRVSVKTETIWGIVGILLLVGVGACLWYVFRTYGRR